MTNKKCLIIGCDNECAVGRYCREHYLQRKRENSKIRYKNKGPRRIMLVCSICNRTYIGTNKSGKYCPECFKEILCGHGHKKNNYENGHGFGYCWYHRRIAEEILKRKLSTNEVVHHMNENSKDNKITNLLVMSRAVHFKLHKYLNIQRVTFEKSKCENSVNCWNTLRVPMTTAWLETTSAKVIKLWEIGQSAAKTL